MDNKKEKYYEFNTEWVSDGKRYGSEILAKTKQEALKLLRDRKLTERITGYDPETTYSFD